MIDWIESTIGEQLPEPVCPGGTGGGSGGGSGSSGSGGGSAAPIVETFSGALTVDQTAARGPLAVQPGSRLRVLLAGTGDADLYVRFGSRPNQTAYDCRPYEDTSAEECVLTVPPNATTAFVDVHGYTASSYTLRIERVGGGSTPMPTPTGTPKTFSTSGNLTLNQQRQLSPISVKPGTQLKVTMTGTGDPDLYVRFAGAPTLTTYDCRPYLETSEECTLTVPASASQFFLMVNGYTASSYAITASYVAP